MSMTDPIGDMLARLRNAVMARHTRTQIPLSGIKLELCRVLKDEGFIETYRTVTKGAFPSLEVTLKWRDSRSALNGLRRISRPGCRRYVGKDSLPRVRGGQGVAVVTTSKGLMADRDARRDGLGGELICEVW